MATPTEDTIQTYISITGASHSLALQKLQEYGGDLNEAVNAHFREGEVHSTSPVSPAYPHHNFPQASNQNQAAPQGLLELLSAARSFNPSLPFYPDYRGDLYNRIGSSLTGRAPSPSQSPGASAEVTGVPVGFNPGNEQWQQPHYSGQRPTSRDVGRNDLHASQYGNDVVEEMIQAAIEASKQEAEVGSLNMRNRPVNVSSGNVLGEKIPEENSDLDRAVSLSLETAEQEKAMHEMQLKDKTQGKLALHSDELGNLSPEELNEAMMLEAALFGESSHAPNMQHVALSSSSLSVRQLLRKQQNDEYLASLIADKEKGKNAVNQVATSQLKEVNKKRVEPMELERRPAEKKGPLPCEPAPEDENAVTLLVQMPNGSRLSRRFRKSDKLQLLFDFIDVGKVVEPGTYKMGLLATLVELTAGVPHSLPQGVQFEFQTLPVDAKAVGDGDGVTVYVSTADPRESSCVPNEVQMATIQRSEALEKKNYKKANTLHQQIIDAGYRVLSFQNEDILARKYRIRLRGIDAPEIEMPYGKEAKDELVKLLQGKCLRVLVYVLDRYGRCVGDIYSDGIFAQEVMLKKGFAWHYTAYDQRPELARWEKEAQEKRIGLWASSNPEKPWDWRRNRRDKGKEKAMCEMQLKDKMQGKLALHSDELGNLSPEELNEAMMLETALFGESSHAPNMQHVALSLSSLSARQLLREQQNDEYLASLIADKKKEINSVNQAATCQLKEVNNKRVEPMELERRPAEKNAPLPCEPAPEDENAVTLLVRMPNGSRLIRRFRKSDKLQLLFDFIDVGKMVEPGTYRVVRLYPRQALTAENSLSTLSELGITNKQEALFLEFDLSSNVR